MSRLSITLLFFSLFLLPLHGKEEPKERTRVTVTSQFYNPNRPENFQHLIDLMKHDPGLELSMWSGLSLPGGGRAPIIMSIAGKTSPDIMESWFHIIRTDIQQGFLYPLNEWIGDDLDGDGQISDEEARWEGWKEVPELWRRVATQDGKIYGIPQAREYMMGILFRTDLIRNAGLDPNKPPQTWDELFYWCMRLSDAGRSPVPGRVHNEGQKGIALVPNGFVWIPWMQSAGGHPIIQVRKDPRDGKEHAFPMEATDFRLPDGTDLAAQPPEFRANFDSPEGIAAAGLIHRLRWAPWIMDPESGETIALTEEEAGAGEAVREGRTIRFERSQVQRGVARAQSGPRDSAPLELLGRGDVAMFPSFVTDLLSVGSSSGLNPDLLSWFPFPAQDEAHSRVVQIQRHYATMCVNIGDRPKAERDKIWEVFQTITSNQARDQAAIRMVVSGLSRFVTPAELQRLGFHDYLRDVPPYLVETDKAIREGVVKSFTEPYQGFWLTMDNALNREVLSLIIAQTGEFFDYGEALREVTTKANSGVMFSRTKAELDRYRWPVRIVFSVIAVVAGVMVILAIRSMMRGRNEPARAGMVTQPWLPWTLLLPALLLIGLWGYYPLLRGMVMAFQDYRVAGESVFVGLDNFITLALDKSFWGSMVTTVYFVTLTMLISFCAPIALAIMLSEVPRGKIFYRTLFFLPQVTSGLVIALLWKMMFDPNPTGFFNQIVALIDKIPGVEIGPQSWLLDPRLAMICVVLPTAWAGAGIQSLIYLAALKGVPEDAYEACEIDSGGIWAKLRHITLPVLLPLIIINFVGAFIATFQNMGNIFLLTFGGPGEATMVAGMRIWIEAYNNLRFSMATSMAWVLGAALIGFTFIQIRFLRRIEFRKAEE